MLPFYRQKVTPSTRPQNRTQIILTARCRQKDYAVRAIRIPGTSGPRIRKLLRDIDLRWKQARCFEDWYSLRFWSGPGTAISEGAELRYFWDQPGLSKTAKRSSQPRSNLSGNFNVVTENRQRQPGGIFGLNS